MTNYAGLTGETNPTAHHLGGNIIEGDPYTYAPTVWDYLIKRFSLESVLDLGSGRGYSSSYFHSAGVKVISVDGMIENCNNSLFPTVQIDLTQSSVYCKVDLVHCQEVVEHIDEIHIEKLLSSLTCGKFIVMTNALPGQGGYHHVNEQPTEYWVQHLRRHNCELLSEDSARIRKLARADGAKYLAETGIVLVNRNRQK